MKALEYFHRQTKEGSQLAVRLLTEVIKLDPGYAHAYRLKATTLLALYRNYDRAPGLLDEAEALCEEALRLKPELVSGYYPRSQIYQYRGQLVEAEEMARECIRIDPQNHMSHFTLGFFYTSIGEQARAIPSWEEAVRLNPDDRVNLWNLIVSCDAAGESAKCAHWARVALPLIDRHLKLHPDDEGWRVRHALLLLFCGRTDDAHTAAMKLKDLKDGTSLYDTACLIGRLGDRSEALRTFRKAIESGFSDTRLLTEFLTDDEEGILSLQGTTEYDEVKLMVEKIEAEGAKLSTPQEGIAS
jgi:tetratricopeptide (TPR) repeat protein